MTCESDLTTVLANGSFTTMNQALKDDGTRDVVVVAKNGKVYRANVTGLYTPDMVINTCEMTGG